VFTIGLVLLSLGPYSFANSECLNLRGFLVTRQISERRFLIGDLNPNGKVMVYETSSLKNLKVQAELLDFAAEKIGSTDIVIKGQNGFQTKRTVPLLKDTPRCKAELALLINKQNEKAKKEEAASTKKYEARVTAATAEHKLFLERLKQLQPTFSSYSKCPEGATAMNFEQIIGRNTATCIDENSEDHGAYYSFEKDFSGVLEKGEKDHGKVKWSITLYPKTEVKSSEYECDYEKRARVQRDFDKNGKLESMSLREGIDHDCGAGREAKREAYFADGKIKEAAFFPTGKGKFNNKRWVEDTCPRENADNCPINYETYFPSGKLKSIFVPSDQESGPPKSKAAFSENGSPRPFDDDSDTPSWEK
jgi:antitoxin component YwqK of YwqJK toxin-antitoxin module